MTVVIEELKEWPGTWKLGLSNSKKDLFSSSLPPAAIRKSRFIS